MWQGQVTTAPEKYGHALLDLAWSTLHRAMDEPGYAMWDEPVRRGLYHATGSALRPTEQA